MRHLIAFTILVAVAAASCGTTTDTDDEAAEAVADQPPDEPVDISTTAAQLCDNLAAHAGPAPIDAAHEQLAHDPLLAADIFMAAFEECRADERLLDAADDVMAAGLGATMAGMICTGIDDHSPTEVDMFDDGEPIELDFHPPSSLMSAWGTALDLDADPAAALTHVAEHECPEHADVIGEFIDDDTFLAQCRFFAVGGLSGDAEALDVCPDVDELFDG